jgi:hypothetical protein
MFVNFKEENIQYHRKSFAQSIVAAASGGDNGELSDHDRLTPPAAAATNRSSGPV